MKDGFDQETKWKLPTARPGSRQEQQVSKGGGNFGRPWDDGYLQMLIKRKCETDRRPYSSTNSSRIFPIAFAILR
jgi:hypothetical protein